MTTAKQVINGSLRKLGAIDPGEGASANEVSDALNLLNRMLYNWSVQQNGIYSIIVENFTLTNGKGEYTWGSGGDFDSTRPIQIHNCYFRENDVDTLVTETTYKNYATISNKNLQSSPSVFLYHPEYPKAKIVFYPVPDDDYTVYFQAWKPLVQYSNASNDLDLPPEYEEALEWNLAMRLAPEYLMEATQTITVMAKSSFLQLKNLHSRPVPEIKTNIM